MICALTVRKIKPGRFDDFHDAFMAGMDNGDPPPGFVRFDMVRNTDQPDEVICFGLFEGTADQLRESADEGGYAEQLERIAPYVDSIGADGLYEVVEELNPAR